MIQLNAADAGVDLFGFSDPKTSSAIRTAWGIAATASAILCGYHGVKRNNGSAGWGLLWFLAGGTFPLVSVVIASAQGFAVPKGANKQSQLPTATARS